MLCHLVNKDVMCLVKGTSKKDMSQNRAGLRWSGLLGDQGTGYGRLVRGQDGCLGISGEGP